jgi:hypothetical protein
MPLTAAYLWKYVHTFLGSMANNSAVKLLVEDSMSYRTTCFKESIEEEWVGKASS